MGLCMACAHVSVRTLTQCPQVYAQTLLFDSAGEYAGFDRLEPTARSNGKAAALAEIRQRHASGTAARALPGALLRARARAAMRPLQVGGRGAPSLHGW